MTSEVPKALSIEHEKFLVAYIATGNATEAYAQAYPDAKRTTAGTNGRRLLENAGIRTELARRRADVAARNDVKLDAIVQRLKNQAFADITQFMTPTGGLLPPEQWPSELRAAIASYDAGGAQSSEKIRLNDQPKLLLELWDRLFPESMTPKATEEAPQVTNVQVNVDKLLAVLSAPVPPKS